jgi:hypothetical protein
MARLGAGAVRLAALAPDLAQRAPPEITDLAEFLVELLFIVRRTRTADPVSCVRDDARSAVR